MVSASSSSAETGLCPDPPQGEGAKVFSVCELHIDMTVKQLCRFQPAAMFVLVLLVDHPRLWRS